MERENLNLFKICCGICNQNATSMCYECNNYFCEKCYNYIHNTENNSNHIKENIDTLIPIDLKCPNHPKDNMFLFCVDEKGKTNYIIN